MLSALPPAAGGRADEMPMQKIAEQRARRDLRRIAQYLDEGNFAAAAAAADACVIRFPRLPAAWLRYALVELARGHHREAIAHVQQAIRLDPEHSDYFSTLARAQMALGDVQLAIGSAMRAVALNPVDPPRLHALAQTLQKGGEYAQALMLIERAMEDRPDSPALRLSRAVLLSQQGDFAAAEQAFEAVIAVAPANGRAHWELAQITDLGAERNHLDRLHTLAQTLPETSVDAAWVDYARYLELERLGRDDAAIAALIRGAALHRRRFDYDAAGNMRIFAQMKNWLIEWGNRIDKVHANAVATDAPIPIFIVGMARSGTTLVERMLGNHPDVQHAGESHDFSACIQHVLGTQRDVFLDEVLSARLGEVDWDAVAALYRSRLRDRYGSVGFVTEKLPANYIYAAAIARALPEARLIRVVRDPMDNCFALFRQMYTGVNPFSFDQSEMAQHYIAYEDWMRQVMNVLPDRVLTVRYEQLLAAPSLIGRALYRFCGLQWQDTHADPLRNDKPVSMPGAVRIDRALHGEFIGRWRRHESELQPMHRLLVDAGLSGRTS